jgi:hypothetical protein
MDPLIRIAAPTDHPADHGITHEPMLTGNLPALNPTWTVPPTLLDSDIISPHQADQQDASLCAILL